MNKFKSFGQKLLRNSVRFVAIILISTSSFGQETTLELSKIMAGNAFIGHQPSAYCWDASGETIFFRWNPSNDLVAHYYQYSVKTKSLTQLKFETGTVLPIFGLIDGSTPLCSYFQIGQTIYKNFEGKTIPIYRTTEEFEVLKIVEHELYLLQNQNIYTLNTERGEFIQLSNFQRGSELPNTEKNYLAVEELSLFRTLEDKEAREIAKKNYNDLTNKRETPSPYYLNGWTLDEFSVSDQGKYFAFVTLKRAVANNPTFYMNYITEYGYTKEEVARPKVGMNLDEYAFHLFDRTKDSTIDFSFDALTDLNRIPEFYNDYPDRYPTTYHKKLVFHLHDFNSRGDKVLLEIKSQDNKDRWIGYIDMTTYVFTEINHQHDEQWIGGPGISGWNSVGGNVGWITNETLYYQDEKTGYSHLYHYTVPNRKTEALTSGEYEIHGAKLSADKKSFYITANKNHPGNREFYKLSIADRKLTPILTQEGNHEVILSLDEKKLLVNYSYKNKPWELYIASNEENARLEPITASQSDEFKAYNWRAPEIITYIAADGQAVNGRLYKPDAATKNGAAIFFVHGAGYLQNAHNWWSVYYREYMFNNLLCDLGYTVMDIDYRASEGYGRDFRTGIYRQMGGKDLSDYMDARDYLIKEHQIDSNRFGIYGGSYGGFITLMALLTEPGKFKCGAAIRSVTDWAHYNHPYTSNILNTPEEDPIAYKRSSPIYFADQLSDHLLMLHGMVDDNVQYQDVVRLSQRFIELGKTNWDLIGYPIEPHGFQETTSWIDEYGRILKLFEEELR